MTNLYYGGGRDDNRLRVGGNGDFYDSLIRFDLTAAKLPVHVTSAILRLYNIDNNGGTATGFYVDELHTMWDENYRLPGHTLDYANLGQTAAPGIGWVDVDITQAVNDWLANPGSNFGLQLRPLLTNNNFDFFVSSDATGDEAQYHPQLVVSFDGQGSPTGPTGDNTALSGGVRALYEAYAARDPSAAELQYWTGALQGGTASLDQLRLVLAGEPASLPQETAFVTIQYETWFGRDPAPAETQFWVDAPGAGPPSTRCGRRWPPRPRGRPTPTASWWRSTTSGSGVTRPPTNARSGRA